MKFVCGYNFTSGPSKSYLFGFFLKNHLINNFSSDSRKIININQFVKIVLHLLNKNSFKST